MLSNQEKIQILQRRLYFLEQAEYNLEIANLLNNTLDKRAALEAAIKALE